MNIYPSFSVIISTYNGEKYLNECLDSVINQILQDIEIICINDGSTDNSLKILEEYAKKDNRIKIINQSNAGLATSRNRALKIITGKYCAFVDSDDIIDENMLFELYNYAEKNNLDMLSFSGYQFNEKEEYIDKKYWDFAYLPKDWNKQVFTYKDCLPFLHEMAVSSCLTIYKTEFIKNNNLTFPDGLVYEDNLFWTMAFTKNAKFGILNKKFYKGRLHEESITHNWDHNFKDWIEVHKRLIKYLEEIHMDPKVIRQYKRRIIYRLKYGLKAKREKK